jgi:PKD repeat protein
MPLTFMKNYNIVRTGLVAGLAALVASCGVSKQEAPSISGPSGFAMSMTPSASPETLPRDGQSTSTVRVVVRNDQDRPVVGQRMLLSATTGTLSASDVTTDSSGTATVRFTAPAMNTSVSSATIAVTPVGNLGTVTSGTQTVIIALEGPNVPVASFAWNPPGPGRMDIVSFDATSSTLNGTSCLENCTYRWDFGDGDTATGRLVRHRFNDSRTYPVRLTVTSSASGTTAEAVRSVVVGNPTPITAEITVSPTDLLAGEKVYFDANSSRTPDGAQLVGCVWDFGDGSAVESGAKVFHVYSKSHAYTVRLTITDETGRTATITKTITIADLPKSP